MAPLPSPRRDTLPVRYELLRDFVFAPMASTCATSAGFAPRWKVAPVMVVVHQPDFVREEEVDRPDPDPPCTIAVPLPQCSSRCAATRILMGSPSDLEQLSPSPSRMAWRARTACAPPSLLRVPLSTPMPLLATKVMPVYKQHTLVYGFSISGELPSFHLTPCILPGLDIVQFDLCPCSFYA
ncbi:uncharacterized protein [Triticum aestivum]|uniref:uncharacterized protein n=1 Tax=Triticum aestivum TaxID=4565 RepID=UPI001D01B796|nr:uncharacterized protein LOC123086178 [Triticum aestivum]